MKSRLLTSVTHRFYTKRRLDSCEVLTQMLTFLCCLVVVSGLVSFELMLWYAALGMVWFIVLRMERG